MDGWVYIGKRIFIGGKFSIWMHVPLPQQDHELLLCEVRVHLNQWDRVKGAVPCREPWILPFVRHGVHVVSVDVGPTMVPQVIAFRRRRGLGRIAFEPFRNHIVVELLAPEQPRICLPGNSARRATQVRIRLGVGVKLVGFPLPCLKHRVEILAKQFAGSPLG